MEFLKWFSLINVFSLVLYIQVIAINDYKEKRKLKRQQFPCLYNSGICTVKVTHKNCSGGLPNSLCEAILNNKS